MIGLCGLSSWDAPTPVQCIVPHCPDGLSGSVVYPQAYGLSVVRSNPGSTMLGRFSAISPLVKLLVQPNRSIVIAIAIVIGGRGGGGAPPPPHYIHPWCGDGCIGFCGQHIALLCSPAFRDDECASLSNLHTLKYPIRERGVFAQFWWPKGLLSLGAILGGQKSGQSQVHSLGGGRQA